MGIDFQINPHTDTILHASAELWDIIDAHGWQDYELRYGYIVPNRALLEAVEDYIGSMEGGGRRAPEAASYIRDWLAPHRDTLPRTEATSDLEDAKDFDAAVLEPVEMLISY